jgi:hypothetical protein
MASATALVVRTKVDGVGDGRQPRLVEAPEREVLCQRFGKALEAGLPMDVLGERSGLHRTEIGLLERAGREPKLSTILKIAEGLRVTPG